MRRLLLAGLIALVTTVVVAAPAQAHAILVSSSPADGGELAIPPNSISLTFDEDVLLNSAQFTLFGGNGEVVARSGTTPSSLKVIQTGARDSATDLDIALPPLRTGSFALQWRVQSADDLHSTTGSIAFGVGQSVSRSAPDRAGPLPDLAGTVLRWLDLLALALMLGSMVLWSASVPRVRLSPDDRLRWTAACAAITRWAAGAAALLSFLAVLDDARGVDLLGRAIWGDAFGYLVLLHLVGLVIVAATPTMSRGPRHRVVVGSAVLCVVAGLAASGHVGLSGQRPLPTLLLSVHLAAGLGWAGAVALLAVAGRRRSERGQVRAVARAFAPSGAVCVGAVLITGLVLTGLQVASVDALVSSTYGRILIVKVLLVAVAGGLGGLTFRRLRRSSAARRTPISRLVAEAVGLALVLVGAAALSVGTPARGPVFAPAVVGESGPVVTQVDGLLLTAEFAPGAVGQNWVRIGIDDTRRPARAPLTGVTLTLVDPVGAQAVARELSPATGSDLWQTGDVTLDRAGSWTVDVAVHRVGLVTSDWQFAWVAGDATPDDAWNVRWAEPWARLLDWLAVLLAAGCAATTILAVRRRSRTTLGSEPQEAERAADLALR